MGLFSGIFGGSSPDLPKLDFSAFDNSINGVKKYTKDITGLDKAGLAQQQMLNQQMLAQQANAAGQGAANTVSNIANSSLFGMDSGARERAGLAGQRQTNQAMSDLAGRQLELGNELNASNLGKQDERQYQTTTSTLPNLLLGKQKAINQNAMAQFNAQQAANAAASKKRSGLFSLAGAALMKSNPLAGAAFGGIVGNL